MIIPRLKPMNIDPVESDISDSLMERISMPDDLGLKITDWQPGAYMNTSDYVTSNDYFEMVRLKIERHKKYPDSARARHIEGQTVIGFVIAPDGHVSSLKVVRSSKNSALDNAALNAVKEASPFPRPPKHLFKGPISLEITIAFELT